MSKHNPNTASGSQTMIGGYDPLTNDGLKIHEAVPGEEMDFAGKTLPPFPDMVQKPTSHANIKAEGEGKDRHEGASRYGKGGERIT